MTLVLRGAEIVLACAAATLVSGLAVIGSRTGSPSLQSYVSMIALGFGVTVLALLLALALSVAASLQGAITYHEHIAPSSTSTAHRATGRDNPGRFRC